MSRIGRVPIPIPQGVTVDIRESEVCIAGPKGNLKRVCSPRITIVQENNQLLVSRHTEIKTDRAFHGLTRTLLANMVEGVSNGFEKTLEIVGAGYRARQADDKVILQVGFSHQVEIAPISGTTISVEGPTRLKVQGIDKELVGEMSARIRAVHPPDHYKGKGIRYSGEKVRIKAHKKVAGKKR